MTDSVFRENFLLLRILDSSFCSCSVDGQCDCGEGNCFSVPSWQIEELNGAFCESEPLAVCELARIPRLSVGMPFLCECFSLDRFLPALTLNTFSPPKGNTRGVSCRSRRGSTTPIINIIITTTSNSTTNNTIGKSRSKSRSSTSVKNYVVVVVVLVAALSPLPLVVVSVVFGSQLWFCREASRGFAINVVIQFPSDGSWVRRLEKTTCVFDTFFILIKTIDSFPLRINLYKSVPSGLIVLIEIWDFESGGSSS